MYFSKKEYSFIGFEKSKAKGKKYSAIIKNKKTGKTRRLNFGDSSMEHYKDSTGLGLWSHKNHGDKERRRRFRARHKGFLKDGFYSPSFFSYWFLWK